MAAGASAPQLQDLQRRSNHAAHHTADTRALTANHTQPASTIFRVGHFQSHPGRFKRRSYPPTWQPVRRRTAVPLESYKLHPCAIAAGTG